MLPIAALAQRRPNPSKNVERGEWCGSTELCIQPTGVWRDRTDIAAERFGGSVSLGLCCSLDTVYSCHHQGTSTQGHTLMQRTNVRTYGVKRPAFRERPNRTGSSRVRSVGYGSTGAGRGCLLRTPFCRLHQVSSRPAEPLPSEKVS